jgi:pseudouridine-5'-phosphate glycosidase
LIADLLVVGPEVVSAIADRRPVVALESTLITHCLINTTDAADD